MNRNRQNRKKNTQKYCNTTLNKILYVTINKRSQIKQYHFYVSECGH